MKPKWNDADIKELFLTVEREREKKSLLNIFRDFALKKNKQTFSVRNFYYIYLKGMRQNPEIAKRYGINLDKHPIVEFEHFNKTEEEKLKTIIENKLNDGLSVRGACLELSNGDIAKMLRYQNKYRNIQRKKVDKNNNVNNNANIDGLNQTKVYKFPSTKKEEENSKLSDDDIKSLFMGLVNLVKQNERDDNQKKIQTFLKKTEEDRRKFTIELEQKNMEINRLNQSINELKLKNIALNKNLENYRIDYVKNNFDNQNLNNNL